MLSRIQAKKGFVNSFFYAVDFVDEIGCFLDAAVLVLTEMSKKGILRILVDCLVLVVQRKRGF